MNVSPLHLAAGGNDFTGAIIFFVIWAAIGILSQIGKWQQKKRQQQTSMQPPPPPPVPMQPSAHRQQQPSRHFPQIAKRQPQQRPAVQRQQPRQQQMQRPQAQRQQLGKRQPPVAAVPASAPQVATREPEIAHLGRMGGEIGSSTERSRVGPAVSQSELKRALRPTSLRKQVLLMELLQPPLSIREQRP